MKLKTLLAVSVALCTSITLANENNPQSKFAGAAQINKVLASSKIGGKLKDKINKKRSQGIAKENEFFDVYVALKEVGDGSSEVKSSNAQNRFLRSFIHKGKDFNGLTRYKNIPLVRAQLNFTQLEAISQNVDVQQMNAKLNYQKFDSESHPLTDVDLAQNIGHDGTGVTIAIIDDGIDYSHSAFGGVNTFPNAKIIGGRDFADNDENPKNDCNAQSHGTAVAGVAVGDGGGITGVAPGAKAVMLKIQSNDAGCMPESANYGVLDGDIVAAIDWVISNKETYDIKLISMSLGGGEWSSTASCDNDNYASFLAVKAANEAGIAVLAASGNGGLCNAMGAPACLSNVISVGAVYDANLGQKGFCVSPNSCLVTQSHSTCAAMGMVAAFEDAISGNATAYSNSADFLDVTAPATCAQTALAGGGVKDCFGGTSSATPFTSGIAALAIGAAQTALSPEQLRQTLISTGDNSLDPKNGQVKPRVNAMTLLNEINTINCVENCTSHFEDNTAINLPDNNGSGVTSSITVSDAFIAQVIEVTVNISHTAIGDLMVNLISPSGVIYSLHNQTGNKTNNLYQTFTVDITGEGVDINGSWTLSVSDNSKRDLGILDNWSLDF